MLRETLEIWHDEEGKLRAEVERLKETIAEWQEIHGTFTGDVHAACQAEIERLRVTLAIQIEDERDEP